VTAVRMPDGRLVDVPYLVSSETERERQRILTSRYFLCRQGSLGEIFRCSRCNGKHTYLSLMCVEQPFSGIGGGLVAYYRVMGTPEALARMSPKERARFREVAGVFDPIAGAIVLRGSHPVLAATLARDEGLSEHDASLGSIALGILEPVPQTLAQKLLDRINLRGGRLVVPGLVSEF
jgi:hypothetical protein